MNFDLLRRRHGEGLPGTGVISSGGERSSANTDDAGSNGTALRHYGLGDAIRIWLLRRMLQGLGSPPLEVALWNGERICESAGDSCGTVHIRDRATLRRLIRNPTFAFGEAYSSGDIDVEGNLAEVLTALYASMHKACPETPAIQDAGRIGRRLRTLAAARNSIYHHYDIGNEFYKLWLDEQLIYTCADFSNPQFSLEQAQVAKLDHVCRKLRLSPGTTVIEAGCGWGALALHIAKNYGAKVKAFNVSREQLAFARARAISAGIADRVEFIEDDYRNITGSCDAFVSVGMLEHVGVENYRILSDVIQRTLRDTGVGLIHTIGRNIARPMDNWAEKYIFPGAYPPSLREMMDIFEPWEFSILDIENLRLHYAKTLEHWLNRFENAAQQVADMFDERFVRMWRLYLAGSIATFLMGELQLFQVVFTRSTNNEIPWTRSHLYSG